MALCLSLNACSTSNTETDSTHLEATEMVADSVSTPAFSGDFLITGYPVLKDIHESFCEDKDCPTYRYVYLQTISSDHAELVGQIGLGCLDAGKISTSNDSDEYGLVEKKLDEDLTGRILSATKENPISLHVTKLPLTNPRIEPGCSSPFSRIEIKAS